MSLLILFGSGNGGSPPVVLDPETTPLERSYLLDARTSYALDTAVTYQIDNRRAYEP